MLKSMQILLETAVQVTGTVEPLTLKNRERDSEKNEHSSNLPFFVAVSNVQSQKRHH